MSFLSRPLAAALLSAAVAIPCFASAQSTVHEVVVRPNTAGAEVRAEKVSFSDLNLDHPSGARALLQRIRGAAQRVCGPEEGLHSDDSFKVCVRTAVNRAVTDLDNPLVSSLNQKRG